MHPALFVEMRLGKNIVVIRTCKYYKPKGEKLRVLIVAPTSALYDWYIELQLEFIEDIGLITGSRQEKLDALDEYRSWNLMNVEGWQWIKEVCFEQWDAVVFDESTAIRNPKAAISKFFVRNFRNVAHRWILAGIPDPEKELEYVNQLMFLDTDILGYPNYYKFRAKYCIPKGYRGHDWVLTEGKKGGKVFLRNKLAEYAYFLQRKDVKSLGCLGEKEYKVIGIDLEDKLKRAYIQAEKKHWLILDGLEDRNKFTVGKHSMLRKFTGGFINDELVHTLKFDELTQTILDYHSNDKIVIFAEHTNELVFIKTMLDAIGIHTEIWKGQQSTKLRFDMMSRFRTGDTQALVCQSQAVTFGANLAVAKAAFYYSRPMSSLKRRQTEDRVVLADKEDITLIYDIVIRETVDEDIYLGLINKEENSELRKRIIKRMQMRLAA